MGECDVDGVSADGAVGFFVEDALAEFASAVPVGVAGVTHVGTSPGGLRNEVTPPGGGGVGGWPVALRASLATVTLPEESPVFKHLRYASPSREGTELPSVDRRDLSAPAWQGDGIRSCSVDGCVLQVNHPRLRLRLIWERVDA